MKEEKNVNKKSKVIILLVICLLLMCIGYFALTKNFKEFTISTNSNVNARWNVKIKSMTNGEPHGGAENTTTPKFTSNSANINVRFSSPGDSMTYKMTIANEGNLNAILSDIILNPAGDKDDSYKVEFTNLKAGDQLPAGEEIEVYFKVTCINSLESKVNIFAALDYVQDTSKTIKSNNSMEITNNYTAHKIGDEITLDNNTKWYVIEDNGKDGYITLLSKNIIRVTDKEMNQYKTDKSGNLYANTSCEKDCEVKYEDSQIKKYLNETYKNKLKKTGIEFGRDGEIRLININELGTIGALIEIDGKIDLYKAPNWITNETYGTWYTMTDGENSMYLVKSNGNISDQPINGTANLRPVIKVLTTNIQK